LPVRTASKDKSLTFASTDVFKWNATTISQINAADDWSVRIAFTDVTVMNESKYVFECNAAKDMSVRNMCA
jgi:hypothetical protein